MKLNKIKASIKKLHHDERGEIPVGPILVIGLIVIPLVVMLAVFRDNIAQFLTDQSAKIASEGTDTKSKPAAIGK